MKHVNKQQSTIAASSRQKKPDLVVHNGKIIDVYTLTMIEADLAISDGVIVGIGDYPDAVKKVDAKGAYICPGLIDGHIHIESTMVPPEEFSKIVVPKGVTTVIADPHEIANVGGMEAVRYMIEASKGLPLDVKMMVPSCVPCAIFEHNGAELTSNDVQTLFAEGDAFGLGEVMDYPAVLSGDEEMLAKIESAKLAGKIIDGHAAGLDEYALNAYRTAGIVNDHEAVSAEEALARVQRGMYVLIREGTAAKDLEAILPAVTPANARRFAFATDDRHLDHLVKEGSIDGSIRKAISLGMPALQAIQLATLNAAEAFGLKEKGAIAPGCEATFLLISELTSFTVEAVYEKGRLVAEQGEMTLDIRTSITAPEALQKSMNLANFSIRDFQLPADPNKKATIISVKPGSIMTKAEHEHIQVDQGLFQAQASINQLKLVVAERHKKLGHIGLGIVKGIPIQNGAIVSTVAHDSHNVIACGTDDASIYAAMKHVEQLGGGMAIAKNGAILASIQLDLAGLMSTKAYQTVQAEIQALEASLTEIGFTETWDPFLTLAFLALPVIPAIKLTDTGLFDVLQFKHIPLQS
ncbi:adenine deaminase [Alkalicoccobacillus porphyridii]|uniref:Adenine deaminase n=1 Tax=Alkalicoccobacillus porphyridii TaxID=2597270 RepID=A0A553ZVW3_9BACI|nr:adenine deaminase [Alkalicoccobacillus porphyridii]TSB45620.1 adenine deaminase [Alkalicoccobacillus porphyridii]